MPIYGVGLFLFLLVRLVCHGSGAPNPLYTYCPNTTESSSRSNQVDTLLSGLSAAANGSSNPGFYSSSVGAWYGIYLCRGDDDATSCRECVAAAAAVLSRKCPRSKQAVAWYDECMIRYSNASFSGVLDANVYLPMRNAQNITGNVTRFGEVLGATVATVLNSAAGGGPALKFATQQAVFNEFQTVYVLGQCTPDLSGGDCYQCLQACSIYMPGDQTSQGARVLFFSCTLRYEIYPFYRVTSKISPIHTYCPNTRSATAYGANIASLLSALSATANTSSSPGFYNDTVGWGTSEAVYGFYLCRGDLIPATCRDCVAAASTYLQDNCPRGNQAVALYDDCMIRYSTEYFFGQLEPNLQLHLRTTPNLTTDNHNFQFALGGAIMSVRTKAVQDKAAMFGTDQENVTNTHYTVYMLGQCIPDLSTDDCTTCLASCSQILQSCCSNQMGAGVYFLNCNLRFELYQFYSPADSKDYNLTTQSTPAPAGVSPTHATPTTPNPSRSRRHIHLILTASILAALVLLFLGLGLLFSVLKKKAKAAFTVTGDLSDTVNVESLQMDFNTIRTATQNFASDKKLGQGGFGSVYKGTLENGQDIAVKRLSTHSGQGIVEFETEVIVVAKLQHRNLVKLLGFCVKGKEKILVYEFLPNSSLDKILYDRTKRMSLTWETRFKIIYGIAKGLMYLHEDSRLRVVHRDLKSSNILLDDFMNPKIADFGLAKLFGVDQTQAVTDSVAGTYGYMAPEYILMGHYSIKSDVYSYGIIVLEVLSGLRNKYLDRPLLEEALLYRAWKLWNEGEALKLMDESLDGNYAEEDAIKCIQIGLLCIQESAAQRPNMTSIVAALGGQSITLPLPSPPNFFSDINRTSTMSTGTSNSKVSSGQGAHTGQTSEITELQAR